MKKMMLIGFSLSRCVLDIVRNEKKAADVLVIISGTKFGNEDSFCEVLDSYSRKCWSENPGLAIAVARNLYDTGRVVQPRLRNQPYHRIGHEVWMEVQFEDHRPEEKIGRNINSVMHVLLLVAEEPVKGMLEPEFSKIRQSARYTAPEAMGLRWRELMEVLYSVLPDLDKNSVWQSTLLAIVNDQLDYRDYLPQ